MPAAYHGGMIGAVVMWGVPAMFALLAVWSAAYLWSVARRRRRGDTVVRSAGGTLGFDDVWRPSAAEAQIVWEAERVTPIPAPTPDAGPGVIGDNRIVIEVPTPRHPDPSPSDLP